MGWIENVKILSPNNLLSILYPCLQPWLLGLLDLKGTEFLNADKGYDSEAFRELIHSQGVHANIPRKKNAKTSNGHMDWLIGVVSENGKNRTLSVR